MTHVNVRVDRLDDAVRFYRDVMGLAPTERLDNDKRGAWFRMGINEIHLTEDAAPQPPSQRHFAVEVADLAEARREFEAARVAIEKEDVGRFWVRDPAGNRIELVQSR
jgi:catechol 2,3-dioxygenase-like lactoylglutathione lyase family enzyme